MVRPTQQSSTKRKRKSNDLIWARDGDHQNAQEHPAYLLENCNEEESQSAPSNDDEVWVEWSSNGTIACIPKSRICTVLSSRRSRRTNDTMQPAVNNEQTTTNNNEQKKRAPSNKRPKNGQSISSNSTTNTLGEEDEDSKLDDEKIPQSDDEKIPGQIIVEGCGIIEFNGTYNRVIGARSTSLRNRLGTYYNKSGEWKGKEVDFMIYRGVNKGGYWYIGIYNFNYGDYWTNTTHFYKVANNTERPPLVGWKVMGKGSRRWGEGIDPPPTLRYIYKTIDNSITSSISDVNKVKEETKVKEEMYGRETDNEEDKKIAAVPTSVVSSQLKKEEYDDDTDDDVAPDPVKSSQVVKVKDEEEDTDDDAPAPDLIQSTQIKEEAGEDTDEAVESAQVKQVKIEEAGEDTDTDDKDGKITAKPSIKKEVDDDSDDNNEADEEEDSDNGSLDSYETAIKGRGYVHVSQRELLNSLVEFESGESLQKAVVGHKLNLERGVIDHEHIKCTGLSDWADMEDRQTRATEFVWWIGGPCDKFYCLPKNVYEFWARLYACKTWGDIRSSFTKGFYIMLMEMCLFYGEDWPSLPESPAMERKIKGKRFLDDMKFDMESCRPNPCDLDMADNFPPHIEMIQYGAFMWHCRELMDTFKTGYKDGWVLCFRGEEYLGFEASEKSKVLDAISKYSGKAQYEPGLSEFYSIYNG